MIKDKHEIGLIVQDYRLAKDKEEQICISAQLNGTDTAEIRKIIYDAGEYKVGRDEILRALQNLQKGGKNHTLGTLRLWMAAFKDCGTKVAKRILMDYRLRPWAEPIPDEEFQKAFNEEIPMVPVEKRGRKISEPTFSAEDKKMIVYALSGLIADAEKRAAELKVYADEKLRKLNEAQKAYDDAKLAAEIAATQVSDMENLIGRMKED